MDFLFLKERYIFFTSIILTAVTGPYATAPQDGGSDRRSSFLPALAPDQEYDREGCFSGSAIEADGKQALIYTEVTTEKLPDGKEEVRKNQFCLG